MISKHFRRRGPKVKNKNIVYPARNPNRLRQSFFELSRAFKKSPEHKARKPRNSRNSKIVVQNLPPTRLFLNRPTRGVSNVDFSAFFSAPTYFPQTFPRLHDAIFPRRNYKFTLVRLRGIFKLIQTSKDFFPFFKGYEIKVYLLLRLRFVSKLLALFFALTYSLFIPR